MNDPYDTGHVSNPVRAQNTLLMRTLCLRAMQAKHFTCLTVYFAFACIKDTLSSRALGLVAAFVKPLGRVRAKASCIRLRMAKTARVQTRALVGVTSCKQYTCMQDDASYYYYGISVRWQAHLRDPQTQT